MPQQPPRLILASASPRRHELLSHLRLDFDVVVSGFDESSVRQVRPHTQARRLAVAKALEAAARHPEAIVLAADTVVAFRGEMLDKPAGASEAREMLRKLRGRVHRVITGVAVVGPGRRRPRVAHVTSLVRMRSYTDEEIEASIDAGIPFDKAGGYGIQDTLLDPVQTCDGCYCNVMGLPLGTAARLLRTAGLEPPTEDMPERCRECPDRH